MNSHRNPHRQGDQLHCGHCGKQWDVNDPEPPSCISWPDKIRNDLNLRRHCCNSTCRQDEIANDMKRLCDELERFALYENERITLHNARSEPDNFLDVEHVSDAMRLVLTIRNKYK